MSDVPYGQTKDDGLEEGFFFAWQVFSSMGLKPTMRELVEQVRKVTEGTVELPSNEFYEKDESRYSKKQCANILMRQVLGMAIWRETRGLS